MFVTNTAMNRYSIFIVLWLCSLSCLAQVNSSYSDIIERGRELRNNDQYSESIKVFEQGLNRAKGQHLKERVSELEIHISISHWYAGDLDKAYQNFETVLSFDSTSVHAADAFHNTAILLERLGKSGNPKRLLRSAITIYRNHDEPSKLGNALLNLGNREREDGQNAQALNHLLEAVQQYKKTQDNSSLAMVYDGIGAVHEFQHSYETAKRYYYLALRIFESLDQKAFQSNMFNNLGTVFRSLDKLDSSVMCFQKSIRLKNEVGTDDYLAETYHNLASVYVKQERFNQAEKNYRLALDLKRGKDSTSCAYSFNELGRLETLNGNYEKAQKYLDSCNLFNAANDPYVLLRNFENKALLFEKMGNYELAYKARTLYANLYESHFNNQQIDAIQGLQQRFEAKEKKQQIASLKSQGEQLSNENIEKSEQIKNRNIVLVIISISLLIFILLAFLIYQRIKLKQSQEKLSIQEEIKREMSEDLHEVVVANLAGIRYATESIEVEESTANHKILEKISTNLHDVSGQVRFIAHRLSPITKKLQEKPLTEILQEDLQEFEFYTQISVKFSEMNEVINRLSETQMSNVYGIIREALNNTAKHAHASEVTLSFRVEKRNLVCEITDNGKGYIEKSSSGIGLENMEQRAKTLKGTISFTNEMPGTKTTLIFPHKLSL